MSIPSILKDYPFLTHTDSSKLILLDCYGIENALMGLSLNKDKAISLHTEMLNTVYKLAPLDNGHNKVLESIYVWFYLEASMSFWTEFDTYRVGITKQSQSRMHTILKKTLSQENFTTPVPDTYIDFLNDVIKKKNKKEIMELLPMGFKQGRMVCVNLKCLRNIIQQRKNHQMDTWPWFCMAIVSLLNDRGYDFNKLMGLN